MKGWLDAAMVLGKDKNAVVICPECQAGTLLVKDEPIPQWKKIDRYIICNICGKWNVMTGNYPDSGFYFQENLPGK